MHSSSQNLHNYGKTIMPCVYLIRASHLLREFTRCVCQQLCSIPVSATVSCYKPGCLEVQCFVLQVLKSEIWNQRVTKTMLPWKAQSFEVALGFSVFSVFQCPMVIGAPYASCDSTPVSACLHTAFFLHAAVSFPLIRMPVYTGRNSICFHLNLVAWAKQYGIYITGI